ncbi:MAG: class I SAM-dependent rRNA methyltransferase [Deinococcota bacterium]
MSLATLRLADNLAPALASGHPWLYRNHLPKHDVQHGEWVRLEAGKQVAFGRFDANGAIGVRIFSHERVPDISWFEARVTDAVNLRAPLTTITNAYRLLYGESDGLPSITADLYGRYIVMKHYANSIRDLLPVVAKILSKQLNVQGVNVRGIVHKRDGELVALYGQLPPPEVTVQERGLKLIANLYQGQKTGLFLDHRDNRETVARFCEGRRVLNLFSYTGAFSLYAARAGANHVTSVDIAKAALVDAERNVKSNNLDIAKHDFLAEDCFEVLETYTKTAKPVDVIICDPPSLAKNKKSRGAALRAYTKLNRDALRALPASGILATASCTAQVSPDAFRETLAEGARTAGCRVQILHEAGHALDHPVAAHFPEGRYLKFIIARKYATP